MKNLMLGIPSFYVVKVMASDLFKAGARSVEYAEQLGWMVASDEATRMRIDAELLVLWRAFDSGETAP